MADSPDVGPLVSVHVWQVPGHAVPRALLRMAVDRPAVRSLRFGKLLGTGSGETFRARDVDVRRWALLACWPRIAAAENFETGRLVRGWDALATERARLVLRPLAARGRWSGRTPFGAPTPAAHDGPVVALTRARLRPHKAVTFWRAVPPVSAALRDAPGLRFRMGVGEAPIGLQGTLSVWANQQGLNAFAYSTPAHIEAVRRTPLEQWYSEELFARFALLSADGILGGADAARLTLGS